jgi:hypothetical protein
MCSLCGKTVINVIRHVSKGGNGLCPGCDAQTRKEAKEAGADLLPANKRWEEVVRDKLLPLVTDENGVPFCPEMVDDLRYMLGSNDTGRKKRKTREGESSCDTNNKRRPDILYVLRDPETNRITHALDVEIDEHSHGDRTVECELSRPGDVAVSLGTLAMEEYTPKHVRFDPKSNVPIVFTARFNPNAFDGPKAIKLEDRIQVLASFCSSFLRSRPGPEVYNPNVPHVKTFFYHSKEGGKHLAALANAKDSIIFHGNVVSAQV